MTTPTVSDTHFFCFNPSKFDKTFDKLNEKTSKAITKVSEISKSACCNSKSPNVSIDASTFTSKKVSSCSITTSKSTCNITISTSDESLRLLQNAARNGLPEMKAVNHYYSSGSFYKITYEPTGRTLKWKD